MSFLKWKTHTRKFLVVVGQSYETFRQADPHLSTIIAKDLALFEEASAVGLPPFYIAMYCKIQHQGDGIVMIVSRLNQVLGVLP